MNYGIANRSGRVVQEEVSSILNFAWENGIKCLDTAEAYGASELAIGTHLETHPSQSWKIITKIRATEASVANQIDSSTKKIGIQPAVLLAHDADSYLNSYFQEGLVKARDHGMISKVGVSLYHQDEVERVMSAKVPPEIIQLPMNILDTRLYRNGVLTELDNQNIEIHIRSVFLQGLFYLTALELKDNFSEVIPYLDRLRSISESANVSVAELSLLWLESLEQVSKIVVGVDNSSQLHDHLATLQKSVGAAYFDEALSIQFNNEQILNPSLWHTK
tara:strand:+ start:8648 stop:9475 length:828 start_codon:yes stop_codon:yes gene_type:complete